MYICSHCKNKFNEPKWEKEVVGTDNQWGIKMYSYCPYCDSSNFKEFKLICSNCKKEIKDTYFSVLDNILQIKYFDSEEENIFCSQECFCEYVQLEEFEYEEN